MEGYLVGLAAFCLTTQQGVDIFKAWLDRRPEVTEETRRLLILLSKVVIAAGTVIPSYIAIPFKTGTAMDMYPALVIVVSISIVAAGSQFAYFLLEIVKTLAKLGQPTPPVG